VILIAQKCDMTMKLKKIKYSFSFSSFFNCKTVY